MPQIISTIIGAKPTIDRATLTTAQTDVSGATATNVVDVKTAGSNGSFINSVDAAAQGNTLTGMIIFFLFDGTNRYPIGSLVVPPVTVAAGTPPFIGTWFPANAPLQIPTGWKLQAATYVTNNFALTCKGGDN
jgi:hypothetical protein